MAGCKEGGASRPIAYDEAIEGPRDRDSTKDGRRIIKGAAAVGATGTDATAAGAVATTEPAGTGSTLRETAAPVVAASTQATAETNKRSIPRF